MEWTSCSQGKMMLLFWLGDMDPRSMPWNFTAGPLVSGTYLIKVFPIEVQGSFLLIFFSERSNFRFQIMQKLLRWMLWKCRFTYCCYSRNYYVGPWSNQSYQMVSRQNLVLKVVPKYRRQPIVNSEGEYTCIPERFLLLLSR